MIVTVHIVSDLTDEELVEAIETALLKDDRILQVEVDIIDRKTKS